MEGKQVTWQQFRFSFRTDLISICAAVVFRVLLSNIPVSERHKSNLLFESHRFKNTSLNWDDLMQSGYLLHRLMAHNKRLYSGVMRSEWRQWSHCSSLSDSCMVNISKPRSKRNGLCSVSIIYCDCILIATLTALPNAKKSSLLRVLCWKVWANSDNRKWHCCCAVSDWKRKWKRKWHGYLNVCVHDTW